MEGRGRGMLIHWSGFSAGASGTPSNSGFISTSGSGAALPCAGNPDGKASSSTLCFGDLGGSDLVLLGSSW